MTKTWTEIFDPVRQSSTKTLEPRPQQVALGQAIIDAFEQKKNLAAQALVGTGKSFAVLVPMIDKIRSSKAAGTPLRGVVSTETTALQDQYVLTDLPFLSKVYPGFKYASLKGRTNYLCFNVAKQNARGNAKVQAIVAKIDPVRTALREGERRDVERVLKRELDDHMWAFLSGSTINCGDGNCKVDDCYSTAARARALASDLVVVNHAILRVDADTSENEDRFLGQVDMLAVDEAHTLESVLISGWTEELAEWELLDKTTKIHEAIDHANSVVSNPSLGYKASHANEGVADFLKSVTKFFALRNKDTDWKFVTDTICLKYVNGGGPAMANAMTDYEVTGLASLEFAVKTYKDVLEHLTEVAKDMAENKTKGMRKVSKGRTAAKDLISILSKIIESMGTKDGTIVQFGVPYVVTASGIERRNGDRSVRISVVPLDISTMAATIWENRSCIIMSGTLEDLTEGSFRYATTSLGFTNFDEISTDSPFEHTTQQLVYVTPGLKQKADVKGAQFSMEELIDLITAARGRTLVLFTARAELDYAASHIRQLVASGEFPWRVLVQDKDANKTTLKEEFQKDTHSVLFATKSFFTGNDFPGETLSLVALCKFPLPQFNVVCRQQVAWWRRRGFPNWYEREALAVFHQAAGRLIRTGTDTGVVALLDQRAADREERVCQTALTGVQGLGSPVTQDIAVVKKYLDV